MAMLRDEARLARAAPSLQGRRLSQARPGADGDLSRGPGRGEAGSARAGLSRTRSPPSAGGGEMRTRGLQRTAGPRRRWTHAPGSRGSGRPGRGGEHTPSCSGHQHGAGSPGPGERSA